MASKKIMAILDALDAEYGTDYVCYLNHENAWQLLIATMLSAQCTDARVNIVTKDLFVKYPNVQAFADADLKELEQDIHSTGFYHNKAKNIIACAAGASANTECLKKITPNVLMMNSLSAGDMAQFFAWVSSSVKMSSKSIDAKPGEAVQLPPPPQGFVIVP